MISNMSMPLSPASLAPFVPSLSDNCDYVIRCGCGPKTWAHAVNSQVELQQALSRESRVDALETDLQMGLLEDSSEKHGGLFLMHNHTKDVLLPIDAHPPGDRSDLSVSAFLDTVNEYNNKALESDDECSNAPIRTVKFDMKEIAVVSPTLEILRKNYGDSYTILLNADIIPGPGMRHKPPRIDGDAFISTIEQFLSNLGDNDVLRQAIFLSIGWGVTYKTFDEYTRNDINSLFEMLQRYNLADTGKNRWPSSVVTVTHSNIVSSHFGIGCMVSRY